MTAGSEVKANESVRLPGNLKYMGLGENSISAAASGE